MALAAQSGGRGRGRRRRRGALSEINVTPLVDVMLVLLIIFMVSAPLLTVGVPVDLPKTDAAAMDEQAKPLTVSVQKDGAIFLQDQPVSLAALAPRLEAMAVGAPYATVAQVMAKLSTSGFTAINLITDSGETSPAPAQP